MVQPHNLIEWDHQGAMNFAYFKIALLPQHPGLQTLCTWLCGKLRIEVIDERY
jgi:hypothetical protein